MNYFMFKIGNIAIDLTKNSEVLKLSLKLKKLSLYDVNLMNNEGSNGDL